MPLPPTCTSPRDAWSLHAAAGDDKGLYLLLHMQVLYTAVRTPGAATLGDAHGGGNVVETLVQYLVALVVAAHMVHMVPLMKHTGQHMVIGDIAAQSTVLAFLFTIKEFFALSMSNR